VRYGGQADDYDDFRKRLLCGREDMLGLIPKPKDGVMVDLGGGTGSNLEYIGEEISNFKSIYVVDLATSLLEVCSKRASDRGWKNIRPTEGDATKFTPEEGYADVVTFSYSLTMIPDWFAAIENAYRILKPGGQIGVVDFYVSRKHADEGMKRHGWFTRSFWPVWFASDNVFPSRDHLPFLQNRFETQWMQESKSKVPYIPFIRTPFYQFIGRKPAEQS